MASIQDRLNEAKAAHAPCCARVDSWMARCTCDIDAREAAIAAAEARGRQWAIDALRDRAAAGTVVGRLLARTNGNVNGIEIAAELADYLDSLTKEASQ